MRAVLGLLFLVQGGAGVAPREEERRWFTEFGENILAKAELVLVARVERSLDVATGTGAAILVPVRVLHGRAPEGKVVVLGDRGTFAASEREDLYLLDRWREGNRWRVRARLTGESAEFAAKVRWVEGNLRASAHPTRAERLRETKRFLLDLLREESAVLRLESVLELRRWADRFPDRFEAGDSDRLRAALEVPDPAFHRVLLETLEALARRPSPPAPASRPVSSRPLTHPRERPNERRDPLLSPPPRGQLGSLPVSPLAAAAT